MTALTYNSLSLSAFLGAYACRKGSNVHTCPSEQLCPHYAVNHAGIGDCNHKWAPGAGASLAGRKLLEFPMKSQLMETKSFCICARLNIGQQIPGSATPGSQPLQSLLQSLRDLVASDSGSKCPAWSEEEHQDAAVQGLHVPDNMLQSPWLPEQGQTLAHLWC